MPDKVPTRTGGDILADQLAIQGVDRVFGVPGESYLGLLDGLYRHRTRIQFVTCRHEAAAANMAEADGKLTGRPGIAAVTRGPGACHAAIGLHTAFQDSTPMILLVGQVARETREREAFQEIDYRRMFGPVAKFVAEIDSADRVPELVARAFATATSGRPGPVVLALPEDMLVEHSEVADAKASLPVQAHPGPAQMAKLRDLLLAAARPFLIIGGGAWSAKAKQDIEHFARTWQLPMGVSLRCQDYVDNDHECYAGDVGIAINPALAAMVREADLLIVAGPLLGEMTTSGYTLVDIPVPRQTLVHIHAGAEVLGRVYQPDLAINAGSEAFAAAALALEPPSHIPWSAGTREAHLAYQVWQDRAKTPAGALDMAAVVRHLRQALPDDAILASGAGNYATWFHRVFRWRRWRTQLAPTSGAMGYGVPAAIAASLRHPDRIVIAAAGDGCFLMAGHELATAMQYGAKPIILVVNNGMYGTIRMHQEREYPCRTIGTGLGNPDFVAYARAFGLYAERVTETEAFPAAFERAQGAGVAALIELVVDPQAITPEQTLSGIRDAALTRRHQAT
jgi:acetolactate synthase-1/2/3 large subunit